MSNKNCELEFEIEKLQKELKQKDKIIDLIVETINNHDIDEDICKQMGKKQIAMNLRIQKNVKSV